MSASHEDLLALAAPYVLGALDPTERQQFEAHLTGCAACKAEVRSLRPVVDGLARAVPDRSPSPALRARVLASVRADVDVGPRQHASDAGVDVPASAEASAIAEAAADRRSPGGGWSAGTHVGPAPKQKFVWADARVWLPMAALLLLTIGIGVYASQLNIRVTELEARLEDALLQASMADRVMTEARRVAAEAQSAMAVLSAPDLARIELAGQRGAPDARARALWSRQSGMVFTGSNLPPLQAGKVYQVWVLTGQTPPISAGVLTPDDSGRGVAYFSTPQDIPAPLAVAVTMEAAGGVPAPTTDVLLVGKPAEGL